MLTKSDLKQIQNILREEIESESKNTKQELLAEIKLARLEIQNDINNIGKRLKNVEIILNKMQKILAVW